jgi:hypothetical protein
MQRSIAKALPAKKQAFRGGYFESTGGKTAAQPGFRPYPSGSGGGPLTKVSTRAEEAGLFQELSPGFGSIRVWQAAIHGALDLTHMPIVEANALRAQIWVDGADHPIGIFEDSLCGANLFARATVNTIVCNT